MNKTLKISLIVAAVIIIAFVVYIILRKKGVIGSFSNCCSWDSAGNCKTKKVNGECPRSGSGPGK